MRQEMKADRLIGWASIGGYIGRDARTAQRYERDRDLPVYRMPGEGRSTVFALRPELDRWMYSQGEAAPAAVAAPAPTATVTETARVKSPAPSRFSRTHTKIALLSLGALIVGAGSMALGIAHPPRASPVSQKLFDEQGAAAWSQRTPASLTSAIDDYTQAVVKDPNDAAAYVGLANSYNLAPEIMGMAPASAFPRAQAAAERALLLAPKSPDAHRALGFTLFWWAHDALRGEAEFKRALELDPEAPLTHHWYANVLAARGDLRALSEINLALAEAPSPAVLIDKGWILSMQGRHEEAKALLGELVRLQPGSAPAHAHLGETLRRTGDIAGGLRELRKAAELLKDDAGAKVLADAEGALGSGGAKAALTTLAVQTRMLYAEGRGSAFRAALAASDVRDREEVLRLLQAARRDDDPAIICLKADPDFAWLRGDRRFAALAP